MTDDLMMTNERDPTAPTPPKPHRTGLPVLTDKRPPLPRGMQPGDPDFVSVMYGERVTLERKGRWPGTAKATMKGPRGLEVYVRLDQGTGAWFPLDELGPADETLVATAAHVRLAVDVARNAEETVVLATQVQSSGVMTILPTAAQIAESSRLAEMMDFS